MSPLKVVPVNPLIKAGPETRLLYFTLYIQTGMNMKLM